MGSATGFSTLLRRLGIIILIIIPVAIFLSLYYYKYIPANRDKIQQYGFLILNQHQAGINQSISDIGNFFVAEFKKLKDREFLQPMLFESPFKYSVRKAAGSAKDSSLIWDSTRILHDDRQIEYTVCDSGQILKFNVGIDEIVSKILETGRSDFFQYYYIVCSHSKDDNNKPKLFFSSSGLTMAGNLIADSVYNSKHLYFGNVNIQEIKNTKFKSFTLPIQLEKDNFLLTGLISDKEFLNRVNSIPFDLVNKVLIAIILILISMPFIKIFFISPIERFGIKDISFLGLSIFCGSAVIMVIVFQILMQLGTSIRTKNELRALSEQIHTKFTQELTQLCEKGKEIDKKFINTIFSTLHPQFGSRTGDAKSVTLDILDSNNRIWKVSVPKNQITYPSYTVVQWTNSSGAQKFKTRLDGLAPSLINVKGRQYFKDLFNERLFTTDSGKNRFSIQPVYSMTTSGFETNIAMRSGFANHMVALSTQMRSIINTILPIGYGFYIIDEKGVILFQSDGKVTLRENFLEWLNDGQKISYGLASRESRELSNVEINNKPFSLHIQPINNLPWQIVTYHQMEFSESSILHIISFILFFLAIYFPFVFVFCFLAWQRTQYLTRLNKRIDQYTWLKPGENKQLFLRNANLFMLVYCCFTLLYIIIIPNNTPLLFIAFWFPVFSLTILYMLYRHYVLLEEKFLPLAAVCREQLSDFLRGFNIAPITAIAILNFIFFYLEEDGINRLYFGGFQILSFGVLWMISTFLNLFRNSRHKDTIKEKISKNELHKIPSQLFWFLAVISISIVPTCCFFTFAQKNEIDLVIKNRQLRLMQKAESRVGDLQWLPPIIQRYGFDKNMIFGSYFEDGIYHLDSKDRIKQIDSSNTLEKSKANNLYRRIIDKTSWNYRSLDKILPVSNGSTDSNWNWNIKKDNQHGYGMLSFQLKPDLINASRQQLPGRLQYIAHLPGLLEYLNMNNTPGILMIIFFATLLLCGLFFILRSVLYRVFLTKYMIEYTEAGTGPDNLILKEIEKPGFTANEKISILFRKHNIEKPGIDGLRKIWKLEYEYDRGKRKGMEAVEENILFNQHYLQDFYSGLWEGCDTLEQYCLYNLARNGFINYKNTRIIRSLYFKGLLLNDETNNDIRMISLSFSNFILDKGEYDFKEKIVEINQIQRGSWSNIRTPIMITITAVGAFLFITEQGVFEKTAALLPTLSGLLGLAGNLIGSKSESKPNS
jgi:hypothetical protein